MDFASALNQLKRSADQVQRDNELSSNGSKRQREDIKVGKAYMESEALKSLRGKINSLESHVGRFGADDKEANVVSPPNAGGRHVCLLFITIDDLPHENIWREFIENANVSNDQELTVSVLVHAKFPFRVRSHWLRDHLILSKSHRPDWGSVEITRAMIDLLEEGMKGSQRFIVRGNTEASLEDSEESIQESDKITDKSHTQKQSTPPDKFVFLSESCLPICSLCEMATSLYSENLRSSWMYALNAPNNGYAQQLQWDKVGQAISKEKIWKADQWIVLSRYHASLILDIPEKLGGLSLWPQFQFTRASDELYFPTALGLLGFLKKENLENNANDILRRRVTFCDWSAGAKNPATFIGLDGLKHVYLQGRENGCLFARKFDSTPISVSDWKSLVLNDVKDSEVR